MGVLTTTAFSADVTLGSIDAGQVMAAVKLDSHGRPDDPRDIVGFLAMLIVAVMRGCRNAPDLAEPYVDLCRDTAELVLRLDAERARTLHLHELINPDEIARSDSDARAMLAAGVPTVTGDPGPRPHRRLRAELKIPRRGGTPFVSIRSANAYIAAFGTCAIFEQIAHTQDYAMATRPAAEAVIEVLDRAEQMDASPVPDRDQATLLYMVADNLALGENPPEQVEN